MPDGFQQYAPIMTGQQPQMSFGMEGSPFMQAGPYGMLLQMLLAGPLRGMMGSTGLAAFGMGHDRNVYDSMRHQEFTRNYYDSLRSAAVRVFASICRAASHRPSSLRPGSSASRLR